MVGYNPCVTHRRIITIVLLLALHRGAMAVEDLDPSARTIALKLGDGGIRVHGVVTGFRCGYMCVRRQFGLEMEN